MLMSSEQDFTSGVPNGVFIWGDRDVALLVKVLLASDMLDVYAVGSWRGEDGGEVVARDPGQVETEGAGWELGQDAPQFLALRGGNHLQ